MSNRKVLVMSVGGSPEPLIHSIDNIKPKLVYFIHSEKTLSVVDEINKNTKHKYDYLTKQVDNHESIEDAFEKSKEGSVLKLSNFFLFFYYFFLWIILILWTVASIFKSTMHFLFPNLFKPL